MSKKKKKKKKTRAAEVAIPAGAPGMVEALAAFGVEPLPFAEVLRQVRREAEAAQVWGVGCSVACCDSGRRDGVLVVVPRPEQVGRYRAAGGDPALRPISVIVHDGHRLARPLSALLDAEDAKRLVNALGEAIALAEALAEAARAQ